MNQDYPVVELVDMIIEREKLEEDHTERVRKQQQKTYQQFFTIYGKVLPFWKMAKMTTLEMTINLFNAAGQQSYSFENTNIHVTIFKVDSSRSKKAFFNKRSNEEWGGTVMLFPRRHSMINCSLTQLLWLNTTDRS